MKSWKSVRNTGKAYNQKQAGQWGENILFEIVWQKLFFIAAIQSEEWSTLSCF
jgi:hypothetical protein